MGFIGDLFGGGGHSSPAPAYDAEAEKKAAQEATAKKNKKRIMEQTSTNRTSALGATGDVNTARNGLLGG